MNLQEKGVKNPPQESQTMLMEAGPFHRQGMPEGEEVWGQKCEFTFQHIHQTIFWTSSSGYPPWHLRINKSKLHRKVWEEDSFIQKEKGSPMCWDWRTVKYKLDKLLSSRSSQKPRAPSSSVLSFLTFPQFPISLFLRIQPLRCLMRRPRSGRGGSS